MCKKCWNCSETFSLPLVAGKNQYAWPSGLTADGKDVMAIAIRRQNAAGTAKDYQKQTLCADAVIATASLFAFVKGQAQKSKALPLDFIAFPTLTDDPVCVDWKAISFNDTYVLLDPTVAGFTAGQVIEITVWYNCPVNC